jgi:hypothetical protein
VVGPFDLRNEKQMDASRGLEEEGKTVNGVN